MNPDLERCDREIAETYERAVAGETNIDGMVRGLVDWRTERVMIEREQMVLKAPFPWFGGKSKVAPMVWERFGNVDNYVEPFAGSLAVLLGRPHQAQTETVNDLDCYLANFWRALSVDPLNLAVHADWPVNEADLHARHLWLVNQDEFRERMKTDPKFFDVKIAGWWVWGISQWIGSGWCSRPEWTGRTNAGRRARGIHGGDEIESVWRARPQCSWDMGIHRDLARKRPMIHGGHTGKGIHQEDLTRKLPSLGDAGRGTHRGGISQQIPYLASNGQGVNQYVSEKRPALSGSGTGFGVHSDERASALLEYFEALTTRLRRVRVCCGDWKRVTGPSVTVKHGICGVFLDPPYDMRVVSDASSGRDGAAPADGLYSHHDNEVSKEVRDWAIENGDNPLLRICLAGYEGEHSMPDNWECVPWKAHGGYGSQRGGKGNENAARERLWFSPHCITEGPLFREPTL